MSSPEILYNGPLDAVRRINDEAYELDVLIAEHTGRADEADDAVLEEVVHELEREHPWIGQEVIAYGTALTMSMDEEGGFCALATPPYGKSQGVRGDYLGMVVRQAYDPESNTVTDRLVHVLQTGSNSYLDDFYRPTTVTDTAHVCVFGSELVPTQPYNAHSYYDLRRDRVLPELDKIVFDDRLNKAERVAELIDLTEVILDNTAREYEKNQQRISYLNSLGLLDGVVLCGEELVITDSRQDYIDWNEKTQLIRHEGGVSLSADSFDLLPRYQVCFNGMVITGGDHELCVSGKDHAGSVIVMPLRNVYAIEAVQD